MASLSQANRPVTIISSIARSGDASINLLTSGRNGDIAHSMGISPRLEPLGDTWKNMFINLREIKAQPSPPQPPCDVRVFCSVKRANMNWWWRRAICRVGACFACFSVSWMEAGAINWSNWGAEEFPRRAILLSMKVTANTGDGVLIFF